MAPRLLNYAVKKTEEKFTQHRETYTQTSNTNQKEGETSVFSKPKFNKRSTKKVGEYIDFEEIE